MYVVEVVQMRSAHSHFRAHAVRREDLLLGLLKSEACTRTWLFSMLSATQSHRQQAGADECDSAPRSLLAHDATS